MCSILLGAINKDTKEYVYPAIANKQDKYICPECNKDLILKKGDIRIHHFSHFKDDNPCNYYNKPTESQIHKDAKMLLKNLIDTKKLKIIFRDCNMCNIAIEYEIPEISESSKINIEYRFNFNGLKIADVAYIDNNEIVCIFEICNTNKTKNENRPEPWFEIDAYDFINNVNNGIINNINCIRTETCEKCILLEEQDKLLNKLVNCKRCKKLEPQCVMDTNINNKNCKQCDISYWNVIYLNVPFTDKDKIKQYGGKFDPIYKKWHIEKGNPKKDAILLSWSEWKP
jgi:uncharacterized protein YkuJ